MENLAQLNIIIHVIAGVSMLVTAPMAFLINIKNKKNHRLSGKVFNYAMSVVGITTLIGVLKDPTNLFMQFLFAILIFTVYAVIKGVRAIQIMKGSKIKTVDYLNLVFLGLAGIYLVSAAIWTQFFGDYPASIPILFGAFGLFAISDIRPMYKALKSPPQDKLFWFRMHIGSMMGAFIASCTAFTVNALPFLPMLVGWFGPTLILTPLIIYYSRKFAPKKKRMPSKQAN